MQESDYICVCESEYGIVNCEHVFDVLCGEMMQAESDCSFEDQHSGCS